jgi:Trypsin-like peptidase domain/TIR domain
MDMMNSLEEQLIELLRRCTVRLSVPGGHGTGFFVAPGTILSCAHVVKPAQEAKKSVTAYWNGQAYAASIQRYLAETHPELQMLYPDLALLKVDKLSDHPCVYLHEKAHLGDKFYSYGYIDDYKGGDPATFVSEGWTDERKLLKLKAGQAQAGMSGAPVLNLRTGGVCGVMKRSRGVDSDLGGRAVPVSRVFEEFPELREQQRQFHQRDRGWYDCLTQEQREKLGVADPTEGIEVFFLYADVDEDKRLVDKLERHLAAMQKQRLITTWNKGKLGPGEDETSALRAHMDRAKIILLMVSPDFMALHYLDGTEVEQAMEKRKKGTIVIPVLLRPTDYRGAPFEGLAPLPTNREPVTSTKWSSTDAALYEVTLGIRKVVEGLKKINPR